MPTINLPKKKYTKKDKNLIHRYVYNTVRWKKLRKMFLINNPLCANCLEKGIVKSTEDIHHIIPISTAGNNIESIKTLGFDENNLKALCEECHIEIHKKMKR